MSSRHGQGCTDRQHLLGPPPNGILNSTLNLRSKKCHVCGINTTVHVSKAVGGRDEAVNRMIKYVSTDDLNLGMVAKGSRQGTAHGRVQVHEMELHRLTCGAVGWPSDPSSATRPTGRHDCNSDAMAGFAAAHGVLGGGCDFAKQ